MNETPQCNLIIDSCCDLPFEVVDRPGIELIEFPYVMGGKEYSDDLYQSRSAHDFYEAMRNGEQASTSQISVPTLRAAYQKAIDSGVPTVFLCFSSGLSGSYDAAEMLMNQMKEENPSAELYIVDTRLASVAEALLVYEAMRQRDKGLSAQELVKWAEEARFYVDAEFMVDDLKYLKQGGRVPSSVAYAGSKLDVKPLLSIGIDGKLTLIGVARGRKKGIKQLAEYYEKHVADAGEQHYVVIGHADCSKDAQRLKDALTKIDENILFLESNVGAVIGAHVGPEMIAVVFWGSDKREELSVADRIARKIKGE